ncbi:MAG: STAS domain-containing protein [Phycisphaerae bacterium]|nr:STAS domain-containing protein [Phycisphaerae bacterium]
MKYDVNEVKPGCLVLTCDGNISWEDRDTLAGTLEEHLHRLPAVIGVVMDMQRVEYVNSAGLGALFQIVQRLRGRGGNLAFTGLATPVKRLFHAVGLDRVTTIAENVDSAVERLHIKPTTPTGTTDRPADKVSTDPTDQPA